MQLKQITKGKRWEKQSVGKCLVREQAHESLAWTRLGHSSELPDAGIFWF